MRRSKTKPFGELLQDYLNAIDVHNTRGEAQILNLWPEVVGGAVARRTKEMYIKNQILFVQMNSSVARSELMMIREGLLKALNERVGKKVIYDIVFR